VPSGAGDSDELLDREYQLKRFWREASMSDTFNRGDLVQILATEHIGSVTTVDGPCLCSAMALLSEIFTGMSYYRLNGFPNQCFHQSILKKLGGERPKTETKTEETRDAPVEA
jgi:hypothetical protein